MQTVIFTITVTDTVMSCQGTDSVLVTFDNCICRC